MLLDTKIKVSTDIQEIIFVILPKMQTCMQKISKQLTPFIDHRRKGESLLLKKFKKYTGNIISKKKEFGVH